MLRLRRLRHPPQLFVQRNRVVMDLRNELYRHILGQPSILHESDGEVRCETPFLVARILQDGDTDIFATGRYLDCYKIEDGQARLNERTVVCDSSRIDTLLALPL